MQAFDVMEDLREAQAVLAAFIARQGTREAIERAIDTCAGAISAGGKIITAGNGGSMCDAQHLAEELTGRYRDERQALAAVAICDPSHLTCVGNDYGFDCVFSRFIEGVGRRGDVFVGISTSGNSANILQACAACSRTGLISICLLGRDGGQLRGRCDQCIIVPHDGYADRVQEVHTLIIHTLIRGIEQRLCPA